MGPTEVTNQEMKEKIFADYLQEQNSGLKKTIEEKDIEIAKLEKEKKELLLKYNIEPLTGKIPVPKWLESDCKSIAAQISDLYTDMNCIVARINMTQYSQWQDPEDEKKNQWENETHIY